MAQETMKTGERVWAAINLDKPDRVPISPLLSNHGAATLTNRTQASVHLDPNVALDAMLEVFDDFGGWDKLEIPFPLMPIRWGYCAGLKVKVPGIDLPENYAPQPHEQEVVKPEDYETIAEMGWHKFSEEDLIFRVSDMTAQELKRDNEILSKVKARALLEWDKRDTLVSSAAEAYHPFFKLSLSRSMVKFTEDLYYTPEKIEKALKRMTQETIEILIRDSEKYDCKIVELVEERAGAYFYPLTIFERFWWPYTMEIIDALWSKGIVTLFHLDTEWDKNLPYFKQLPKGSAILSFDGMTDIFAAKEILRNHLCIQGDVHASLLSLGKPEEVESYCKRLIDEVGCDGGFILGVGCEVPTECKPDNLKAMIKTGKTYELNKTRGR